MLNIFGQTYSVDKKLLERVSRLTFQYLNNDFGVNLKFVSPDKIRELNRVYRHKEEATDVLSFSVDQNMREGDIVICLSEAKKQAGKVGLDESSMVALLLAHGILHLAGYTHAKASDRARMGKAEEGILAKAGIELER